MALNSPASITSLSVPTATICPSFITPMRSACADAKFQSCGTAITVRLSRFSPSHTAMMTS
ncbi:MAG: hypothetical protein FJ318_08955 [SAR202 cluster bacterium]|nr:hypothetical protein [SAR202 cluster bacterium]